MFSDGNDEEDEEFDLSFLDDEEDEELKKIKEEYESKSNIDFNSGEIKILERFVNFNSSVQESQEQEKTVYNSFTLMLGEENAKKLKSKINSFAETLDNLEKQLLGNIADKINGMYPEQQNSFRKFYMKRNTDPFAATDIGSEKEEEYFYYLDGDRIGDEAIPTSEIAQYILDNPNVRHEIWNDGQFDHAKNIPSIVRSIAELEKQKDSNDEKKSPLTKIVKAAVKKKLETDPDASREEVTDDALEAVMDNPR